MKQFFIVLFFSINSLLSTAQQTSETFSVPINYLLYLPDDYTKDTTQKWPLLIFLHGSGESGSDIEKVKKHGPPKLIAAGKKFPAIVISPQRGPTMRGFEPDLIMKLILDIKQKYRVDRSRVYLTGLSMGGFGTWNIAMKYPSEFAAIVPICGGGDLETISQLRNTPVWCFHGAKDDAVKLEESTRLVNALQKINPNVQLTVYPEAGHDSWTQTYENDSVYTWLFAQSRKPHTRIKLSAAGLKEFSGGYAQGGKDTADLIVENNKLVVKQHPSAELIPYADNKFYIVEGDGEIELEFIRDKKGNINRFILYADKERVFNKVR